MLDKFLKQIEDHYSLLFKKKMNIFLQQKLFIDM